MPSFQYDVIIVGAGPAGCILSYLLAKSGVDVLLIERDASFVREFRGPAYQPCVLEYFNQMGILDDVLTVGHSTLHEFKITEGEKTLFSLKMDSLPSPYNYAIAMQQGPLLRKLIQLASEYPNLTFLGNTPVEKLVFSNGMVAGVHVTLEGQKREISSRLVVGADGRFSTVREQAGIPLTKVKQSFDLVWFDYPDASDAEYDLGLEISAEGIVVFIPQEEGHVRVGWVLEKGGWAKLKNEGLEKFRERISSIKPRLKERLPSILQSFDQCSFLDVKIAQARDWIRDGLLLIGDAAHIASPVGGQGNKLAIQDAIVMHTAIIRALTKFKGTVRKYQLYDAVKKRAVETKKIFRLQRIMGRAVLGMRHPILDKMRQFAAPLIRTLIAPKLLRVIGHGFDRVEVDTSLFSFHSDHQRQHRYYLLKVKKVVHETKQAASFYFEVPKELQPLFSYKPGQFVTLRILDKGQLHKRCYSLSSIPEDPYLRITVKRVENGLISNDMIDTVKEDSKVLVLPPAGQFVSEPGVEHYCMIAGGSGITPIMSLIRHLLKHHESASILLIDVNHDAGSVIFKSDLDELKSRYPKRFNVIHNLTLSDVNSGGSVGRMTAKKMEDLIAQLPDATHFYLCGPAGLQTLTRDALESKGVPKHQIHVEKFTSLAEPYEAVQRQNEQTPLVVGDSPESNTEDEKMVTIELKGKKTALACRADETILDAALRKGISAPFSCREGICATCMARLDSGKVVMDHHQALTEKDAADGYILTCQARPLTKECAVKYPDP